jgi:hypothetical protein
MRRGHTKRDITITCKLEERAHVGCQKPGPEFQLSCCIEGQIGGGFKFKAVVEHHILIIFLFSHICGLKINQQACNC